MAAKKDPLKRMREVSEAEARIKAVGGKGFWSIRNRISLALVLDAAYRMLLHDGGSLSRDYHAVVAIRARVQLWKELKRLGLTVPQPDDDKFAQAIEAGSWDTPAVEEEY